MIDNDIEIEETAFVGISFSNKVIYNLVDREGEFKYTGLSVINWLTQDRNKFIAKIIESQSYECIKVLLDEEIVYGGFYSKSNVNIDSISGVYNIMKEKNAIRHYYIYDMVEDVIIIKTPYIDEPIALDYHIKKDVTDFLQLT